MMEGGGSSMPNNEEMMIYLKTIKTVPLKVNSSDTIRDVKAKFFSAEGISSNMQELFFAGNHLKNGSKLIDHDIQNGSTVQMFVGGATGIGRQIHIKMSWNGKIITVDTNYGDTVHDIKAKIHDTEGIHANCMALIFAGKDLQDRQTLASYNIQTGCTLFAVLCGRDDIKIFVEAETKQTAELDVKPCYAVETVKTMIQSIWSVPPDQQRLIFSGRPMTDGKKMSDYNIANASTIRMVHVLTFLVQTSGRKRIRLEMESSDTIGNAKRKIQSTESIPAKKQVLSFQGLRLDDSLTLAYYNIQKNSTLQLAIYHSSDMSIFVKTPEGKTITLIVQRSDSIDSLKARVESKVGIPQQRHNLIYAGKLLNSSCTLEDYNIQKDSTLRLAPALFHQA